VMMATIIMAAAPIVATRTFLSGLLSALFVTGGEALFLELRVAMTAILYRRYKKAQAGAISKNAVVVGTARLEKASTAFWLIG
jgi:hypothetical protein